MTRRHIERECRSRILRFEQLEQRTVLAITAGYALGTLLFTGTAADELVRDIKGLDADGPGPLPTTVFFTTWDDFGANITINTGILAGPVKNIHIVMGAGLDTVDLSAGMAGIPLLVHFRRTA